MGDDYGYANARIRGMKSRLITDEQYNRLLKSSDFDDVVAGLGSTAYGRELSEVMIKEAGLIGFDEALRRNVMKAFGLILKITQSEARTLVNVLLGRWDVANIKAVLRGKNLGASSEAILGSMIPGGEVDESVLLELAAARDVRDCVDMMATMRIPYAVPLTGAFPEYAAKRNLAVLEIALDKFFYERSFKVLKRKNLNTGLVREMLKREIDTVNIMTLLRVVKEDIDRRDAEVYFIDGGAELSLSQLGELADKKGVEDVVATLSRTSYHKLLADKMPVYFETGSLTALQRALEQSLIRRGISMFRAEPLSVAGIIGYIWAKNNEVANLRVIARGKMVGMPEAKMREAMVLA